MSSSFFILEFDNSIFLKKLSVGSLAEVSKKSNFLEAQFYTYPSSEWNKARERKKKAQLPFPPAIYSYTSLNATENHILSKSSYFA